MNAPILEVKNLNVEFAAQTRRVRALSDICFSLEAGKVLFNVRFHIARFKRGEIFERSHLSDESRCNRRIWLCRTGVSFSYKCLHSPTLEVDFN